MWDVDGNRFLDFAAGIAVCSTGHAHPQVVQAIKDAADEFLHISSDYWHERMTRLAERINELDPMGEPVQVLVCQSGTESVEGALKLARYVTGRPRFIGFLGGFHGRSMGSLTFTASKYTQQAGFFPTMPGVTHVPYPNVYRPLFAGADQGRAVLEYIENVLFAVQRAGQRGRRDPGRADPGRRRLPRAARTASSPGLRALCDRHGILLIFDEVQSGIGRTGKMFASRALGRAPGHHDARQGPGLRAADRARGGEEEASWRSGSAARTATPTAATRSAAPPRSRRSTWSSASTPPTPRRWAPTSSARLRELQEQFECIGDVRGKGLMIGMELITDRASRKPAAALCQRVLTRAYHNGLILLSCGTSTVRFIPPLMVSREHVDEALGLLKSALREALAES